MTTNGNVSSSNLVTVQGSIQLETNTAAAWNSMRSAAASFGVNLTVASPAGGYRSLATQQDMIVNPGAYNIQSGVTLAAPGNSTHGYGDRVDVGSGNSWAIDHCGEYGFVRDRTDFPGEANHYHYIGQITTNLLTITTSGVNNMATTIFTSYVTGTGRYYFFASPAGVRKSVEFSMASATVKAGIQAEVNFFAFLDGRIASNVGGNYNPPEFADDSSWSATLMALKMISGMPSDYPLSSTNPFVASEYFAENP